ncbi:MAG: DEAD/DEAH box helicase [Thaumarchaeota archaeon]|nr:DEAD/DEAH box helicase [Candidatus Calditenuaceae archaeon]MDW8041819.1 DEAD/DEAH box helicase [Nitrososphaerota archaeon]
MLVDPIELLAKPVRDAILERFGSLVETQRAAIPHVVRGENVLLMAPTGSGKTEAVILPILSELVVNRELRPIAALYITPLRALNRDLLDRVTWWSQRLDLAVAVRHGDTSPSERRAHTLKPPLMLITTPETLQSLLTGKVLRRYLSNLRWVIVDEVHELATDKRGAQLSIALERLRLLAGRDLQVIGLSATVGSAEVVASFLVGVGRGCRVVKVPMPKETEVTILYPVPSGEDREVAEYLGIAPDVAARLNVIKSLVESHRSTLVFTNTRPLAEVLANRFKALDEAFPVTIHHGSLARDRRVEAERDLKYGDLRGLICTSSLEMGIDIGKVDLIVQYNSPREVTRLVQRVGRSGHGIGMQSKGVVIVMDSDDALEAMVISRRAKAMLLEPTEVVRNPLDVALHQIAGILIERGSVEFDELLGILRRAYNFADLSREDLEMVLQFAAGIGLLRVQDGRVQKPPNPKRLFDYYFDNLSMIPEERQYLVVEEESGSPVGTLDESFVAEYGEVGTRFILGGRGWVILSMSGDRIYVAPLREGEGAIPSWVGDEIPVPFEVAQEVGSIRRRYEEMRRAGIDPDSAASSLSEEYSVPIADMRRSLMEVEAHIKLGIPVPSDELVMVEGAGEYVVVHLCGGLRINRTVGRLLATLLADRLGAPISVLSDPYRVALRSRMLSPEMVSGSLGDLVDEELMRRALEGSGVFRRRLVHVARKMGVVEKGASLLDVSTKQLIEALRGAAPYVEALRFTASTDFDWEGAKRELKRVIEGEVQLVTVRVERISPLAALTVNRFLYEFESQAPDRVARVVLNMVRGRLMSERVTLLCTDCYSAQWATDVGSLEPRPVCPECRSQRLGVLRGSPEAVSSLVAKRGRAQSAEERAIRREAERTAQLVERYGKSAVVVLVGRGLSSRDAEEILSEESRLVPKLFELIMEAEKEKLLQAFR